MIAFGDAPVFVDIDRPAWLFVTVSLVFSRGEECEAVLLVVTCSIIHCVDDAYHGRHFGSSSS